MVNPNSKLAEFDKELELPSSTTNVGMIKTMEPMQGWIEENIGEKTLGSRTLGTLAEGKLLTPPSSGFGQEYAAENLPILKDMDPLTRGIYNTLAPYGEKLFDVLDTFIRLPGAGAADIAQAA